MRRTCFAFYGGGRACELAALARLAGNRVVGVGAAGFAHLACHTRIDGLIGFIARVAVAEGAHRLARGKIAVILAGPADIVAGECAELLDALVGIGATRAICALILCIVGSELAFVASSARVSACGGINVQRCCSQRTITVW